MNKCITPCIYYSEIFDKSKTSAVKVICDIREGEEIKNILIQEIETCTYFKTYKEIQENNKKFYKFNT